MTCDVPEPCKFPSLDSCQKRFLWIHKEVDLAPHPVVGDNSALHNEEEKMAATTPRLQQQGPLLPTLQRKGREDPVIQLRLRTGHSRFRHRTFTKFRGGESSACHCGTSPMMEQFLLQDCQTHQNPRAETWPADTPVRGIYDTVENLRPTAANIQATGVPV